MNPFALAAGFLEPQTRAPGDHFTLRLCLAIPQCLADPVKVVTVLFSVLGTAFPNFSDDWIFTHDSCT